MPFLIKKVLFVKRLFVQTPVPKRSLRQQAFKMEAQGHLTEYGLFCRVTARLYIRGESEAWASSALDALQIRIDADSDPRVNICTCIKRH